VVLFEFNRVGGGVIIIAFITIISATFLSVCFTIENQGKS
jgi:hypothetical protein